MRPLRFALFVAASLVSARAVADDAGGDALATNGAACKAPSECASGFCVEGVCCDTACNDAPTCFDFAVATLHCSGGLCARSASTSCEPYGCTAGTCRASCSNDTECAPGFRCRDAKCLVATAECSSDGLTSYSPAGGKTSCVPYRCSAEGTCNTSCSRDDECALTTVCRFRYCVDPNGTDEDHPDCSYGAKATPTSGLALGSLALFAVGCRRRYNQRR